MIKFHQSILFPFVPSPFSNVGVEEKGAVVHRSWGRELCRIPPDGLVIQVKPRGVWGVVDGYGDVICTRAGSTYRFDGVQSAAQLRRSVERRAQLSPEERRLVDRVRNARFGRVYAPLFGLFWLVIALIGLSDEPEWGLLVPVFLGLGGVMVGFTEQKNLMSAQQELAAFQARASG